MNFTEQFFDLSSRWNALLSVFSIEINGFPDLLFVLLFNVFVKMTSLGELSVAELTGIRLGGVVHAHVDGQMMAVNECLFADVALVWTDSQVHFLVLPKNACFTKGFPAHVTSVKLVSAVCLNVALKFRIIPKSQVTYATLICSFPRVRPDVHLQIKDLIEAPPTDMALVRLSAVDAEMSSQVVVLTELPVALVTFIGHAPSVRGTHVPLQLITITKLHLTNSTTARLLVMKFHVVMEVPDL